HGSSRAESAGNMRSLSGLTTVVVELQQAEGFTQWGHTGGAWWIRRRRKSRAPENGKFRARGGLVQGCGADNHRGWNGGAENQGCRVGGQLALARSACRGAATPWRSTYQQYSSRSGETVAESAAGLSKPDRWPRLPRV